MLNGTIKPISDYTESEISAMYALMREFYDDTDEAVFRRDFFAKDYCLSLRHEQAGLVGFTTQKVMEIKVGEKTVHGMFSGDTIIHKDFWGDIELFRVWARFWFKFAENYDEFYWFLICKGYKTYRIMPLFWSEFFPTFRAETPPYERQIINAYAREIYPDEYNEITGVIEYKTKKDKLKSGVADIDERALKNKDVAFFKEKNPNYFLGNDLACLAKIDKKKLKSRTIELLFSEKKESENES